LFAGRHLAQSHFSIGVDLRKASQGRSESACEHGRDVADGQGFFGLFVERGHLFYGIAAATEQVAGVGEEGLSGGRELEAVLFAEE
jgi:hypothetical protein